MVRRTSNPCVVRRTSNSCVVRRTSCAAEDIIGDSREQVFGVEQRVEAVKDDAALRVDAANPLGRADAEAQRRVHRDRDGDQLGAADLGVVPRLDGEVERIGREAGALEEGFGPGDAQGLMAERVAGDEEDVRHGHGPEH